MKRTGLSLSDRLFDTAADDVKRKRPAKNLESFWSTTQYAILIRSISLRKHYARIRASGKLIVKALKTTDIWAILADRDVTALEAFQPV